MDAPVVLRLFALPKVTVAGKQLRFPSRKGLALLIVLALDGVQSREKLARWLWMDSPNPKDALRNALSQVNKVLSNAGLKPLQATRQTIAWPEPRLWVDALQLNGAVDETTLFELRGTWLEGFILNDAPEFDTWAYEQGAFYTGVLQRQLEQQAEHLGQHAEFERALLLAQQRLRLDALDESAYRQLMRLQRRAGRDHEARATLLLCQSTLARELGLAPSAETLEVLHEPLALAVAPAPIGRHKERSWLEDIRRTNGVGLLLGEAGAGKTKLLQAAFASEHTDVIWIECRPNDAALPYSSVLRTIRKRLRTGITIPAWARAVLASFLPGLGQEDQPLDTPIDQMRCYLALNLFFPDTSALLVDDLQFIDEMSAAWLWQLVQRRCDERLAPTVLSYRPDELSAENQRVMAQLERQGARRCLVPPLELTDLVYWLECLGLNSDLAGEFLSLTGGNALFFKEVALAYQRTGDFGQGLLPLLQQRLNTLGQFEWQLTQLVAVAGSLADVQLASQVLHLDQLQLASAWARLEAVDVLHGAHFVHDLLRSATLALTPPAVQMALSAGVLDQLEQRLHLGEHVSNTILAELALQAGHQYREAHYRLLAGLEVYQLGFIRAGIGYLERCLDILEHKPLLLSDSDLELLYLKLMPIYRADVYNAPHLGRALGQLFTIARARGVRQLEGFALANQADWLAQTQGDFVQARALFEQAFELAGQDRKVQYLICDLRAWAENSAGHTQLALDYAQQGLALSDHDLSLKFRALEAVFMFEQNLSLWAEAQAHALQAATVAHDSQEMRHGRPYALTMAAYCALQLGDLNGCEKHITLALQLIENSQWDNAQGFATRVYAQLLLERDDLGLALEHALSSSKHYQRLNNHFALCSSYSTVARIHFIAGRPNECLRYLEMAEQALEQASYTPTIRAMQSTLDNLRCSVLRQLGGGALQGGCSGAFDSAMRAVAARANPPEAIGALLLVPREDELKTLIEGGQQQLAQDQLAQFLGLHPNNPRVQILHWRAQAAVDANPQPWLQQAHELALHLGFTMQARLIRAAG
jgi:DNA-binding SARP family transcriptional activator/tetratricopeptide (TPR) repeat protein